MLCAVWADGLMEDEELDAVSRAINGRGVDDGRRAGRGCVTGSTPASPPTPAVFGEATQADPIGREKTGR